MAKGFLRKSSLASIACVVLLAPLAIYLVSGHTRISSNDPAQVAKRYLTAVYARDYAKAYPWLSGEDQKQKGLAEHLRENHPFSGASLELAYKLADKIEWREIRSEIHRDTATVRLTVRLPDANAAPIQRLSLDFDPDRLAALSAEELWAIEQKIDTMQKQGSLPVLEGEEDVDLVKEKGKWRVFVNWAGAIRIRFEAEVKEGLPWKFWPVQETIPAKPGETLQAVYKAKNLSDKPITAKALHLDEPREAASKYLETIQCFCFIRETLAPGEEKEFPLVLRVKQDVPSDLKEFRLAYEFYPIEKFPKKR